MQMYGPLVVSEIFVNYSDFKNLRDFSRTSSFTVNLFNITINLNIYIVFKPKYVQYVSIRYVNSFLPNKFVNTLIFLLRMFIF